MKVRSTHTSQASEGATASTRAAEAATDVRARGQRLLDVARTAPLAPSSLLGMADASLDTLAKALLHGAALAAERRSSSSEE